MGDVREIIDLGIVELLFLAAGKLGDIMLLLHLSFPFHQHYADSQHAEGKQYVDSDRRNAEKRVRDDPYRKAFGRIRAAVSYGFHSECVPARAQSCECDAVFTGAA